MVPRIPRPLLTKVDTRASDGGEPISLITRIWTRRGALRCNLCPLCNAQPAFVVSLCMVSIPGFISDEQAAMHRFNAEAGDELAVFLGSEARRIDLDDEDD
ncbi:hypothetical protein [Paludisphaera soli]|uniref:hypothetical protein n=1 Tax=Paludisphaera soli TaxID=2712865 RepID=UPI0013EB614C|nr:hypothetical protein [Paludisphaera soli]